MKLSVIIPVYNVGTYLRQCLDSVLSQALESVEIICVNDGSTDNSLEILNEYAEKYPNLSIINKRNTGYGDTMNRGTAAATGEYVAFVESDDLVVPGAFAALMGKAAETGADVIKGNYTLLYQDKPELFNNLKSFPDGAQVEAEDRDKLFFVAPSIWSAIYRRAFLEEHSISFVPSPGAAYQDTSFAFKIWACAESVVTLHRPIIHYRVDSVNSSSNEKGKPFALMREFDEIDRFIVRCRREELFPVSAKAKYMSAIWNINRLDLTCKIAYVLVVHEMFKRDHAKGYLVRKYWNDEEWDLIHRIIFNLRWYCESLRIGYSDSDTVVAIRELTMVSPVYIYGTDKNSKNTLSVLSSFSVKVDGMIETPFLPEEKEFSGVPIVPVETVRPEGIIVMGIGEEKEKGIEILTEHELYNHVDLNLV